MGAYYLKDIPSWLIFWNKYNHYTVSSVSLAFWFFARLVRRPEAETKVVIRRILVLEIAWFFLYFFTSLLISDNFPAEAIPYIDRYSLFHAVGLKFYIPFFTFFSFGFAELVHAMRVATKKEDFSRFRYILLSSAIGVFPAVAVTIFIPKIGGTLDYYRYAPIFTLAWVAFTSYAIIRYQIISVRLIVAEVSVFAMSTLLFANIFLNEISLGIVPRIIIFLAFATAGGFFIKNILENENQREELARLTEELSSANENLKDRVRIRTVELREARAHTEAIIEQLPSGLVEFDESFNLVRINQAGEQLLGISREALLGKSIAPKDVENVDLSKLTAITFPIVAKSSRRIDPAMAGLTDEVSVNEIMLAGAKEQELQIVTARLPEENTTIFGTLKILRDVTKEKLTARSKTEFISIAAHRLRTPLSVIKWILNTFLSGDLGEVDIKLATALSRANETNEKMITLVNDMLNVARIEDGRFGYEWIKADLINFITGITKDNSPLLQSKKINLTLTKQTDEIPFFYFDPAKLGLAIRNIIDNAIKYSDEGGSIELKIEKEGDFAIIRIKDSGIGISEQDLKSIFIKFFRGKNATTYSREGTGLGLYIAKNIIARHGGTIEVQSSERVGTEFIIRLPIQQLSRQTLEEFSFS